MSNSTAILAGACIIAAAVLGGFVQLGQSASYSRYQIAPGPEGTATLLDRRTGEVVICNADPESMRVAQHNSAPLTLNCGLQ